MADRIIGSKINKDGYGIVPKFIMQDSNIRIGAKGLYAYFCSHGGCGDTCFPTKDKVCHDLNISADTFGKYLKQLVSSGYITVEQDKESGNFLYNLCVLRDKVSLCKKSPTKKASKSNKRFLPPNVGEVGDYCNERGNNIDPESFVAFYSSKGWKVGNSPMKDWKAAVITWEKREKNKQQKIKSESRSASFRTEDLKYNIFRDES